MLVARARLNKKCALLSAPQHLTSLVHVVDNLKHALHSTPFALALNARLSPTMIREHFELNALRAAAAEQTSSSKTALVNATFSVTIFTLNKTQIHASRRLNLTV